MKLEGHEKAGRTSFLKIPPQLGREFRWARNPEQILAEQVGQEPQPDFHDTSALTELIPELLDMVDREENRLQPGYELSFLKKRNRWICWTRWTANRPRRRFPSPAAEKVQPGGAPDPRHDAGHHGGRKEKRPGQDHLHQRHPAQIFSPELYAQRMQETIIKLLEQWQRKRQQQHER